MKNTYCKCMLYAYPNVDQLLEQLDTLVEKKALSSMDDFSPCIEQCESILSLTAQKDVLILLKVKLDKILCQFSSEEKELLDYRYFKQKPKENYIGFDFSSRSYFRRQEKVLKKINFCCESEGLNDQWFEKECLKNNFFVGLLRGVCQREESLKRENKGVKKTNVISLIQRGEASGQKSRLSV